MYIHKDSHNRLQANNIKQLYGRGQVVNRNTRLLARQKDWKTVHYKTTFYTSSSHERNDQKHYTFKFVFSLVS